jgi:hypothetical protein
VRCFQRACRNLTFEVPDLTSLSGRPCPCTFPRVATTDKWGLMPTTSLQPSARRPNKWGRTRSVINVAVRSISFSAFCRGRSRTSACRRCRQFHSCASRRRNWHARDGFRWQDLSCVALASPTTERMRVTRGLSCSNCARDSYLQSPVLFLPTFPPKSTITAVAPCSFRGQPPSHL